MLEQERPQKANLIKLQLGRLEKVGWPMGPLQVKGRVSRSLSQCFAPHPLGPLVAKSLYSSEKLPCETIFLVIKIKCHPLQTLE